MRSVPMEHNTAVNPRHGSDHAGYLSAIGYTAALRRFSSEIVARDTYAVTYPHNDLYRTHMRRFNARVRYWRDRVDTIVREHSCSKCNKWTGTHYLHALNMYSGQNVQPEYICDACLAAATAAD